MATPGLNADSRTAFSNKHKKLITSKKDKILLVNGLRDIQANSPQNSKIDVMIKNLISDKSHKVMIIPPKRRTTTHEKEVPTNKSTAQKTKTRKSMSPPPQTLIYKES